MTDDDELTAEETVTTGMALPHHAIVPTSDVPELPRASKVDESGEGADIEPDPEGSDAE